jgi:hypothetical protein
MYEKLVPFTLEPNKVISPEPFAFIDLLTFFAPLQNKDY